MNIIYPFWRYISWTDYSSFHTAKTLIGRVFWLSFDFSWFLFRTSTFKCIFACVLYSAGRICCANYFKCVSVIMNCNSKLSAVTDVPAEACLNDIKKYFKKCMYYEFVFFVLWVKWYYIYSFFFNLWNFAPIKFDLGIFPTQNNSNNKC